MARERYVTRTVSVAVCEVMCMDVETAEVRIMECEVGGGLSEEKELMKSIRKIYETPTFKCVAIRSVRNNEILYGMPESDFIKLAKVLPPRGAKGAEG